MKRPDASADPSAFERFQSLARRLFTVPKKELDEKIAEYREERHRQGKRTARK